MNTQSSDADPSIPDSAVISRSTSAITTEFEGKVVMMDVARGEYFALDDIAGDIWRRIEAPCSFAELIDSLAASYDADRAIIARDVQTLLARLRAQGFLRLG